MFENLKNKLKIWFAIHKAKQEEKKHLVSEQDLEEEDKEFVKEDKQLTQILEYSNNYYKNRDKETVKTREKQIKSLPGKKRSVMKKK